MGGPFQHSQPFDPPVTSARVERFAAQVIRVVRFVCQGTVECDIFERIRPGLRNRAEVRELPRGTAYMASHQLAGHFRAHVIFFGDFETDLLAFSLAY